MRLPFLLLHLMEDKALLKFLPSENSQTDLKQITGLTDESGRTVS